MNNPFDTIQENLKEIGVLGLCVDALGTWREQSGCKIPEDAFLVLGTMIRMRTRKAQEALEKLLSEGK